MADAFTGGVAALTISEDNLGEILETVKGVGTPPEGEPFLRAYQLSKILSVLLETILWKPEKDLQVLIDRICQQFQSRGSQVPWPESLSIVIHRLAVNVQNLTGRLQKEGRRGKDQTTWIFQQFACIIDALRTSNRDSTDVSVMIWRDTGEAKHFPNELVFNCACPCTKSHVEVKLTAERLAGLKHNTSGTRLVDILNLEGYNEASPTDHKFIISGNRSAKKELLADIGPAGFVYCGVQFTQKEKTEVGELKTFGPLEQRYGGCALSTTNEPKQVKSWNPEDYNFYKMGTKSYTREWSQCILVDRKRLGESVEREWKVVDEVSKKVLAVETINITGEGWSWILKYCIPFCAFFWTHPTLVFPEPLQLNNITCIFDIHQCIENKRCLECKIALEKGGNVKATKVSPSTSEELVPLSIPGPAEELFKKNTYKVKPIVSLYVFALSVPPKQRGRLQNMQAEQKVFTDDQFKEIEGFWKNKEKEWTTYYYKDWTTN
jgi:hypothetical protein